MECNSAIHHRLNELYRNKDLWIDPYDTEDLENKYIRKLIKILLYFAPDVLYETKVVKPHIWAENFGLLGSAFLKLGDFENAERVFLDLEHISGKKYYWGLPVDWKSSRFIFPKGLMMSTTTSEIGLFLVELQEHSDLVTDEILRTVAYNLRDGLNKVYEDEDKLILGYTPLDDYQINNSNLLVAAALHEIGVLLDDDYLVESSIKITNACIDGISDDGGVPYFMNGSGYDSYHQIFSLRALYFLKGESLRFQETYEKSILFLKERLMDVDGNVYLSPRKNVIDMQGSAEALRFFKMINDEETAKEISDQISAILRVGDAYIQRYWKRFVLLPMKSRTIFTRQGELRLLLGQIDT